VGSRRNTRRGRIVARVRDRQRVRAAPGARDARPVLATGNLLFGAALLVPLAAADPPSELPGLAAVAGLTGLILLPTVLGQLMLFRMLRLHGSRRSSLVTYLMPGFALVYGSTILDEQVTAGALAGLALILGGVALASGQRILGPAAQETPA
jgi:drug/metabolite transporter (DMT)-like permease